jgi:hypothetical protein
VRGTVVLLLVVWFASTGKAGAEVHLTMQDGRVTLNATNATVAEILAEWAKVAQTQIVNSERVTGELASIELTNVPELQALEVILRSVAGFIAAQRPDGAASPSRFDRIVILPASTPPPVAASTPVSSLPEISQYPQYPQEPSSPLGIDADSPQLATPNPRGESASTYPALQPVPPGVSPRPSFNLGGGTPAGSQTPGPAPVSGAPGTIVQPAPRSLPGYPQNPIRDSQD